MAAQSAMTDGALFGRLKAPLTRLRSFSSTAVTIKLAKSPPWERELSTFLCTRQSAAMDHESHLQLVALFSAILTAASTYTVSTFLHRRLAALPVVHRAQPPACCRR